MLLIGSHVSFLKEEQLLGSVKETISYEANSFMFYTGAPQNTKRLPIDLTLTKQAHKLMNDYKMEMEHVFIHAPYIINLANKANDYLYQFSIQFLKEEIQRATLLKVKYIIIHPGNHVGAGIFLGLDNIINALNLVIEPKQEVILCLEVMSGKGSECGSTFKELKTIIEGIKYKEKIGICLDTCHLNDAGYEVAEFDKLLAEFDDVIGLDFLKVIHINDSKNIKGSHKDRHANIGFGFLGFDSLLNVIYHPKLINIPKILETPYIDDNSNSYPPYKHEIKMIREKKFNKDLVATVIKDYQK